MATTATTTTVIKRHHYALDVAELLETALERLGETLELEEMQQLRDMEDVLKSIDLLVHRHLIRMIEKERKPILEEEGEDKILEVGDDYDKTPSTLGECVVVLRRLRDRHRQKQQQKTGQQRRRVFHPSQSMPMDETTHSVLEPLPPVQRNSSDPGQTTTTRQRHRKTTTSPNHFGATAAATTLQNTEDNLLFRLLVGLQLCVVRISDANYVLRGRRPTLRVSTHGMGALACVAGTALVWFLRSSLSFPQRQQQQQQQQPTQLAAKNKHHRHPFWILSVSTRGVAGLVGGHYLYRWWARMWMTQKIVKSVAELQHWRQQWIHIQQQRENDQTTNKNDFSMDENLQELVQSAKKLNPKSSLWHSEGEMRFLVLKKAMDLYYASVGAAMQVTGANLVSNEWQLPLATMAAASYFSVVGRPRPGVSSSPSSSSSSPHDLIQNAWGMVSLPTIKLLSLRASQILKGAALAERVVIEGVPCFVLSKRRCPDIVVALKRHQRQEQRRSLLVSRLSTIDERAEGDNDSSRHSSHHWRQQQQQQRRRQRQQQRPGSIPSDHHHHKSGHNVILHLTGGGFFAHTIASDLPYLLDWSAQTGAVVICPEYALLPKHAFPVALNQVYNVYCALLGSSNNKNNVDINNNHVGDVGHVLGFGVSRVVVTGESAGGNLAAALCVKLCTEGKLLEDPSSSSSSLSSSVLRLPDALMMSCPALNLSLELSPSRVIGNDDPVLPSGLISAISDAYLADHGPKKDPLASPLFAPDRVLRRFPPTLLFASSDDPLLDDSVAFNQRLRNLGVASELRATHHVPHAYWGLGTAGFPQAQQVQKECAEFLRQQLLPEVGNHNQQ